MPKDSKEEPKKKVPDIAIFKNKKNEPELEIKPERLQVILEYFNLSGEFDVIALECENNRIQVVGVNPTANVMPHYIGMPDGTKIVNDGYFILEPKEVLNAISLKYKDCKMLNLSWKKGEKIIITGDGRSPYKITPQDLHKLNIPPMNRRLIFSEKFLQYNKKETGKTLMEDDGVTPQKENAKSFVTVEQKELLKASADLTLAATSYIIFNFEDNNCWCETGSWSAKGDSSKTQDIELDNFDGIPLEMAFPKILLELIKKLPGEIDIQGTKERTAVVFSQWKNNEEIHYTVVETEQDK